MVSDGPRADDPGSKPSWWFLLPVITLQFAGLALILPALPNLKLRFFSGDTMHAAHVQSLTDSSRALLTTLVSSKLGRFSDTLGRRPLVLLSIVCTVAPLLALILTPNLYFYYALYALAGALGGQSSPAVGAYVADCCPQEGRAKSLGIIGATASLVFMLMPLVGGTLSARFGEHWVFNFATAVEGIAFVFVLFVLPESLRQSAAQSTAQPVKVARESCVQPLRSLVGRGDGHIWQFVVVRFLRGLASSGTSTVLFFALMNFVPLGDADFGFMMAASGLAGIIGQAIVLRLLLKYVCSEIAVLLFATCVAAVQLAGNLLLPLYPSKSLIYALVLLGGGASMGDPAFTAVVTRDLQEDFGLVLGVFASVDGATAFVAPLVFSLMFTANPLAPLALAGALNATAALFVAVIWRATWLGKDKARALEV